MTLRFIIFELITYKKHTQNLTGWIPLLVINVARFLLGRDGEVSSHWLCHVNEINTTNLG
jgi:hypothetical protein